jgi:hypothetical protein
VANHLVGHQKGHLEECSAGARRTTRRHKRGEERIPYHMGYYTTESAYIYYIYYIIYIIYVSICYTIRDTIWYTIRESI